AAVRVATRITLNVIIGKFALNAFGIAIGGALRVPLVVATGISGFGGSFFGLVVTFTPYRWEAIAFPGPYKAVIRIAHT
ncbi:hypothetical protein GGTG_14354, partial [Gaeumannomyces tritici R3-111a-1]